MSHEPKDTSHYLPSAATAKRVIEELTHQRDWLQREIHQMQAQLNAAKRGGMVASEIVLAQTADWVEALEQQVAELQRNCDQLEGEVVEKERESDQLKAHIQRFMQIDFNDPNLREALIPVQRSTPEHSLATHDAEVIERAINECAYKTLQGDIINVECIREYANQLRQQVKEAAQ